MTTHVSDAVVTAPYSRTARWTRRRRRGICRHICGARRVVVGGAGAGRGRAVPPVVAGRAGRAGLGGRGRLGRVALVTCGRAYGPLRRAPSPALLAVAALASWLAARPGEFLVDGSDGSVYLEHRRRTCPASRPDASRAPARPDAALRIGRRSSSANGIRRGCSTCFRVASRCTRASTRCSPISSTCFPSGWRLPNVVGGPHAPYYVSPLVSVVAIVGVLVARPRARLRAGGHLASCCCSPTSRRSGSRACRRPRSWRRHSPLSGVYLAVCCYRRPDTTLGVLCAAAFGLAAFVRIDMLMFVTPL